MYWILSRVFLKIFTKILHHFAPGTEYFTAKPLRGRHMCPENARFEQNSQLPRTFIRSAYCRFLCSRSTPSDNAALRMNLKR